MELEIKVNNCTVILTDKHSILTYRKNLIKNINELTKILEIKKTELQNVVDYIEKTENFRN